MCGILFELTTNTAINDGDHDLLSRIECRGPDALNTIKRSVRDLQLAFTSSVLHLRGNYVVSQPFSDEAGNILCWNGEVWSGLEIPAWANDTSALSQALARAREGIHKVFQEIRGPYAFVYFQVKENKIWFGRDILGRRSLLLHRTSTKLTISSVAKRQQTGWTEVATDGLYCYHLDTEETTTYRWADSCIEATELKKSYPAVNSTFPDANSDTSDKDQSFYSDAVTNFCVSLSDAVKIRTNTIPPCPPLKSGSSRIAVMYSGGVDCAVIARLLHDQVDLSEPIDLLNVSFENPRTIANAKKQDPTFTTIYDTPDRLTGRRGYEELRIACPDRLWRFVEINVPYSEAQAAKEDVLDLMYPNDSIMDFSIALAFYFCGRGRGTLYAPESTEPQAYETTAKVYFSGLGADEQLGGYSRHAAAYRQNGYQSLIAELQMDLDRIPSRNLGRDDRILSNFGREVRWPFLDEQVITFLSTLRIDQKMDFEMEGGEKWILREVGRRLGIPKAAGEKKRAIQFGSRSARMEIERGKADRVKGHNKQQ